MKAPAASSATALAVLGLLSFGTDAQARPANPRLVQAERLDRLAVSVQRQTRLMLITLRHAGHNGRRYEHLLNDARALSRAAAHIHNVAHNSRGRRFEVNHIRRDAIELDRAVHHMQRELARLQRGFPRPIFHRAGFTRGAGHVGHVARRPFGNPMLRRVQYQLKGVSQTVHQLLDMVNIPCSFG